MVMLDQSWSTLPDTAFINSIQIQLDSTQDTGDPFAQLTVLDKLRAPDNLTADTFIATDEKVATSIQSLPSDEKLLHQFTIENTSNENVEMIDDKS